MGKVCLGFDFGLSKIGLAIGQTVTHTAMPQAILKANKGVPDWNQIQKIIDEWGVDTLVVGLPFNMDQSEQPLTQKARAFGEKLKARFQLPVHFVDERLTTIAAKADMHNNMKNRKRFDLADGHSARLILESWFERSAS